jgi:rhodanese-related sulfurtransferase
MRSALLSSPQPHTLTAEEYLHAKLEYELACPDLLAAIKRRPCPFTVLDVRDAASFAKAHLPGALSVPEKELKSKLASVPKGKTVVTYGWDSDCVLAPKAALALAREGHQVKFLSGGIAEWQRRELPVEPRR